MPYVALASPSRADADWGYSNDRSMEVIASDEGPIRTGLVDANGTPLYRLPERIPLGFCRG